MKNKTNIRYIELLNIVKLRLEQHNQLMTNNKEKVLKILFDNADHLCVEEIVDIYNQSNSGSSTTTVYRIVSAFENLGIIESLVVDDKKRYELSYFKSPHYHLYCQECNEISEFESIDIHKEFLTNLDRENFKATSFNVIINGVCSKCQK